VLFARGRANDSRRRDILRSTRVNKRRGRVLSARGRVNDARERDISRSTRASKRRGRVLAGRGRSNDARGRDISRRRRGNARSCPGSFARPLVVDGSGRDISHRTGGNDCRHPGSRARTRVVDATDRDVSSKTRGNERSFLGSCARTPAVDVRQRDSPRCRPVVPASSRMITRSSSSRQDLARPAREHRGAGDVGVCRSDAVARCRVAKCPRGRLIPGVQAHAGSRSGEAMSTIRWGWPLSATVAIALTAERWVAAAR
jgi:hypothetical protein